MFHEGRDHGIMNVREHKTILPPRWHSMGWFHVLDVSAISICIRETLHPPVVWLSAVSAPLSFPEV